MKRVLFDQLLETTSDTESETGTNSIGEDLPELSACDSCSTQNAMDFEDFPQLVASVEETGNNDWKQSDIPKLTDMVKSSNNPDLRPFTSLKRIYLNWDMEETEPLPPISAERQKIGRVRLSRH